MIERPEFDVEHLRKVTSEAKVLQDWERSQKALLAAEVQKRKAALAAEAIIATIPSVAYKAALEGWSEATLISDVFAARPSDLSGANLIVWEYCEAKGLHPRLSYSSNYGEGGQTDFVISWGDKAGSKDSA